MALREIALLEPTLFDRSATTVADFVFDQVLSEEEREDEQLDIQCKTLAIKLLVATTQSLEKSGISTDSEELTQKIHSLLFDKLNNPQEEIRLESCKSILKLCSLGDKKLHLTIPQFLKVGFIVLVTLTSLLLNL
jgi:flagellar biosynthesis regulator FlaF